VQSLLKTTFRHTIFRHPNRPNEDTPIPRFASGIRSKKNTTQIETKQSELGFSIASHVKFEHGFQGHTSTTF